MGRFEHVDKSFREEFNRELCRMVRITLQKHFWGVSTQKGYLVRKDLFVRGDLMDDGSIGQWCKRLVFDWGHTFSSRIVSTCFSGEAKSICMLFMPGLCERKLNLIF